MLLLVFVLQLAVGEKTSRRHCSYDTLPGYWTNGDKPTWQTLDEICLLAQLRDKNSSAGAPYTALLFGDSVDRQLLHDACGEADSADHKETHAAHNFQICQTDNLHLARQPLIGVHSSVEAQSRIERVRPFFMADIMSVR